MMRGPILLAAMLALVASLLCKANDEQQASGGGWLKKVRGGKADKFDENSSIDLRETNCLNEPSDQGNKCDASYALSAAALYEYFYCRIHKTRVRFSAQYIIDCGEPFGLRPCKKGNSFESLASFNHIMGFELASEYAYEGANSAGCPHAGPAEADEAGFIKAAEQKTLAVLQSEWPLWLARKVPLQVTLGNLAALKTYTGGVLKMEECSPGQHQVLLVGQGTEAGQHYWLMRASFGTKWGEGGYLKLSKDSKCFKNDGIAFTVNAFSKVSSRKATLNSNFFQDNDTYNGDKPRQQRAPGSAKSDEEPKRKSSKKRDSSEPEPSAARDKPTSREDNHAPPARQAPSTTTPPPQPEHYNYHHQPQYGYSDNYYNNNYNPSYSDNHWTPRSYLDDNGYGSTYVDDHPVDPDRAAQGWYYDRELGCEARVVKDSWGK